MNQHRRHWWLGGSAALLLALAGAAKAQSVEAGVQAWQSGQYEEAIRQWRPLADRGDVDAQFNLGHAYRLGRGVPRNMNLAEQWYERAARAGHVEAQAMYGLILFQNGRRQEAIPYVQAAAERGDARAQYVYGTALFNGDMVERDWPRAYAFMLRASAQNLPYARSQLTEMDAHLSDEDRRRGTELARALEAQAPERIASSAPPRQAARPEPARSQSSVAAVDIPPSRPAPAVPQTVAPRAASPRPLPARVAAAPAATGGWRVQLGAFSSEANARRAWEMLGGRLPGLQPVFVPAGRLIRLQAGPLPSRAAAERACASVGQACFPVDS